MALAAAMLAVGGPGALGPGAAAARDANDPGITGGLFPAVVE